MTQTRQLSELMQKAEDIVKEAVNLSADEHRTLAEYLKQKLLQPTKPQAEVQALETHTEQENTAEPAQSLLQLINEISKNAPAEELTRLPKDGAEEHDHYIYGTPKRYSKN